MNNQVDNKRNLDLDTRSFLAFTYRDKYPPVGGSPTGGPMTGYLGGVMMSPSVTTDIAAATPYSLFMDPDALACLWNAFRMTFSPHHEIESTFRVFEDGTIVDEDAVDNLREELLLENSLFQNEMKRMTITIESSSHHDVESIMRIISTQLMKDRGLQPDTFNIQVKETLESAHSRPNLKVRVKKTTIAIQAK